MFELRYSAWLMVVHERMWFTIMLSEDLNVENHVDYCPQASSIVESPSAKIRKCVSILRRSNDAVCITAPRRNFTKPIEIGTSRWYTKEEMPVVCVEEFRYLVPKWNVWVDCMSTNEVRHSGGMNSANSKLCSTSSKQVRLCEVSSIGLGPNWDLSQRCCTKNGMPSSVHYDSRYLLKISSNISRLHVG